LLDCNQHLGSYYTITPESTLVNDFFGLDFNNVILIKSEIIRIWFHSEVLKKEHLLINSKRKQKEKGDKRVKGVQIRLK
jgi:hypothetical protein